MAKRKSKKRAIKVKSEKTTILLLLIVILALVIVGAFAVFIFVDETGYFAQEDQDTGSVIDTNSINLSYLDENTSFTFPLEFSEKDIEKVSVIGDNIYVLTSKTLICLSDEGDFIFSKVLNYSSPEFYSNSKYAIAYDEVGGYYIVVDEDEILFEGQIDESETFLLAQVDEYANVFLVTKSEYNSSIFYMYDKNFELVRNFGFTQDYIVNMDIYGSEKILLSTISSQSGYFCSNLYLFDLESSRALDICEIGSEAIISANFISKNTISILTDSSIITAEIVDQTTIKIIEDSSVAGSILNYFSFSKGLVVTSQSFDDLNETIISYYNTDNLLSFQTTLQYKSLDIYADSKYIYVLTSSAIYVLNLQGEIYSELELSDSAFALVSSSSGIYHYSIGVLHKNEYKLSTQ